MEGTNVQMHNLAFASTSTPHPIIDIFNKNCRKIKVTIFLDYELFKIFIKILNKLDFSICGIGILYI